MNSVDNSTRLYDRVHPETIWKWYANQLEKAKTGAPRNTDKYREASDELLQLADAIMKLEAGIKKGQIPELHKRYLELFPPKKVETKAVRQTHNKIVTMPTPGQMQTAIAREVSRNMASIKDEMLQEIRSVLKVAK